MAGGFTKYIPLRRKAVASDSASSECLSISWPLPPSRGTYDHGQIDRTPCEAISQREPQFDLAPTQSSQREAALRKTFVTHLETTVTRYGNQNTRRVVEDQNDSMSPVQERLSGSGLHRQSTQPAGLQHESGLHIPKRESRELWETSPNEPSAALSRSASHVSSRYPETESSQEHEPEKQDALENTEERLNSEHPCDSCRKPKADGAYCNVCNYTFCSECWDMQITHRNDKNFNLNIVPHEKTNRDVAMQINEILGSQHDSAKQKELHIEDEKTTWFGVIREPNEPPIFLDYGRYANLMSDVVSRGKFAHFDTRFPGLVSFVGQTGAGKSTIIKLIIDLSTGKTEKFETPIVGSVKDQDVPTSGDVHLYPDPNSITSRFPILYADCEGLEGGEREPISARFKKNTHKLTGVGRVSSFERKARRTQHTSERDITWADTPKKRSREFAVTHLYPRLLYTFSDVVVFVLKNPRTIEGVFEKLVDWAAAAFEKSSNVPVLPHAIIVLNAAENSTPPELWDSEVATKNLLQSLSQTISENAKFKEYANFWRTRGRTVETVEQLILSYYSSIKVVRIPTHGRPNLILKQVRKLYTSIQRACTTARKAKGSLRMLLDADELQPYLQYAFDHFACDLDSPFDFVQASFVNSPIPSDFGGNILKLAINMMEVWESKVPGGALFTELSYFVASCIMLDSARHGIKGTAAKIFPKYVEHLDTALLNFCDRHWPCEFQTANGQRCVNVRSGHGSKGHQLKSGKVLAVGDYVSEFSFNAHQQHFQYNVYFILDQLLNRLREHQRISQFEEEQAATEVHRNTMVKHFYSHAIRDHSDTSTYISHTACFTCLLESPEHVLPCGHSLCTRCLKESGICIKRNVIEIAKCPIDRKNFPLGPWFVALKPETSGSRILTLDGGGIRGIVELEILRQIESHLNGISIKSFFDLIVGTSTGGIISLGLVANDWSVDHCTQKFKELCVKAFTARTGANLPLAKFLVELQHQSKYETQPLQEALIESFGNSNLFGGTRHRTLNNLGFDVKVAVTSTSTSGNAIILANYNRPSSKDKLSYHFQRPEKVSAELKTWEAARATSAAPRMFKPMCHEPSKQVYIDGAIYHNNPIQVADQERKLLWPHLADKPPDMMLSIGTSYNPDSIRRKRMQRTSTLRLGRALGQVKDLLKIAMDHLASSLDSQKTWDDYIDVLNPPSQHRHRYVRLNPRLLEVDPPELDQVDQMPGLQSLTRTLMKRDPMIEVVALQLIASSFYFERTGPLEGLEGDECEIKGRILCRLIDGSDDISRLGNLLKALSTQPSFIIQEQHRSQLAVKVPIPYQVIDTMIVSRRFKLKVPIKLSSRLSITEISLSLKPKDLFQISNFPRSLVGDDSYHTSKRNTVLLPGESSSRWAGRSHKHDGKNWVPPDPSASNFAPDIISSYSSPSYVFSDLPMTSLAPLTTFSRQKAKRTQVHVAKPPATRIPTFMEAVTKRGMKKPSHVFSPEMPDIQIFEMMDTSRVPQVVGEDVDGFI